MFIMNSLTNDSSTSLESLARSAPNTATIRTAVCLVLPGKLAEHAVSEGAKAVTTGP